jgi:hypothetical protein
VRRRDLLALVAALALGVLIATDAVPALRGPENWRWERRPLESMVPLLGSVGLFGLLVAVAMRIRAVWALGGFAVRGAWLAAAVILVFLQMAILTAMEPGGLSNLPRRVMDPSFTSYHTIARRVEDPQAFLQRYPRIQRTFPVHGPSQPPGRVPRRNGRRRSWASAIAWAACRPDRREPRTASARARSSPPGSSWPWGR